MPARFHVLILGGTTEARQLAAMLDTWPGVRVTSSLAGRVVRPVLPAGQVRIGGFGGPEGLARWVGEHRVHALIDATHPFAGTISFHAASAAATTHVPLLALRRPRWAPGPGDDWHPVGTLRDAASLLPALGSRIFLTTGRTELTAFAGIDDLWFLVRSVDTPEPPGPSHMQVLLERGPFTLDGEREVLRRHRIDVLVTKDSGGPATAPKLTAARQAQLPVVMIQRPPTPEGVPAASTPDEAATWISHLTGLSKPPGPSD